MHSAALTHVADAVLRRGYFFGFAGASGFGVVIVIATFATCSPKRKLTVSYVWTIVAPVLDGLPFGSTKTPSRLSVLWLASNFAVAMSLSSRATVSHADSAHADTHKLARLVCAGQC